jgi:hypothetical protein
VELKPEAMPPGISAEAKAFSFMPTLRASYQYLTAHPELLVKTRKPSGVDELYRIALACLQCSLQTRFRQCVYQATVLNYCIEIGEKNLPLFFQRCVLGFLTYDTISQNQKKTILIRPFFGSLAFCRMSMEDATNRKVFEADFEQNASAILAENA